ncbi:unnamed protein product [Debaryomyces tyrocola]|nr:unnamed protein product [Debaryomyces tyrocola]
MDSEYTLVNEATSILNKIVAAKKFPADMVDAISNVKIISSLGKEKPFIPTSLKLTETSTALWSVIGGMSHAILRDRFQVESKVEVSTDFATLFLASCLVIKFDNKGVMDESLAERVNIYDKGNIADSYRSACTAIYETKDKKWFHLHGSMNPDKSLQMLNLPMNMDLLTSEEISQTYIDEVVKYDSEWLDITANEHFRQAGTICQTYEEYLSSPQGEANKSTTLYDTKKINSNLPPVPWNNTESKKPLAGIKVIDVSRVIAAPVMSRILAYLGADVIRVSNTDDLPDYTVPLFDGNLGKKDVHLNLKNQEDKETLKSLIQDADVFIDGYRPGTLDRLGFSREYIQFLARNRGQGIIHLRENCYGWNNGPLDHRSGWQQISDCTTGVTMAQGKFMGINKPVLPLFPNSDYSTGTAGAVSILLALWLRTKEGGSYNISISLNAINQFILSLGELPKLEQTKLHKKYNIGKNAGFEIQPFHSVTEVALNTLDAISEAFDSEFTTGLSRFDELPSKWETYEENIQFPKCPITFDKNISIGYNCGSGKAGIYKPKWDTYEII